MTPAKHPDQEKATPRVSAVVVSHNRCALLRRCLASLEASEGRDRLQVIVIDNGSSDGSAHLDGEFPKAQFVRLPKNFGLTKAMNIGWRAADAPYVLFLHDDAAVEPSAVGKLADVLDANTDVAAVCPLLVGEDGQAAPQLGDLPPDGHWRVAVPPGNEPFPVEYARGAALMMRVFLIKAIRQIDERYGQFGGDADLAAQILKASKRILLVPEARANHESSTGYTAAERADFLLGRVVFLEKYRGFGAGLQARLSAIFGTLFSFKFAEFSRLVSGQKIDGAQG